MTVIGTSKAGGTDDEAALVAGARIGNPHSFEALVNRFEPKIYRLAKNITWNDSDAAEVAQDVFFPHETSREAE